MTIDTISDRKKFLQELLDHTAVHGPDLSDEVQDSIRRCIADDQPITGLDDQVQKWMRLKPILFADIADQIGGFLPLIEPRNTKLDERRRIRQRAAAAAAKTSGSGRKA
ncbi:MAG: hypothetical protein ACOVNS_05230 [Erythrobacter sp.]